MGKNVQGFDCDGITRQGDKYVVTGCRPIRKTTAATFDEGLDAAQHTRECKSCMNRPMEAAERTKGDVWREIVDGAKTMTEGNTPEQQVSVFLSTPKGAELYRDYGDAGRDKVEAAEPEDSAIGGTAERAVNQVIKNKAATFMASDSSLTEAQAYVRVLTEFPEVYDRYRKAQMVDRKRARG